MKAQGMERAIDTPALAALLRAVAEPQRLALLGELLAAPRSVGELVETSGLAQASVSHHLAILRRSGLVDAVREGRQQLHAWAQPDPNSAEGALQAWLRVRLSTSDASAGSVASGNCRSHPAYPQARRPELDDHLL